MRKILRSVREEKIFGYLAKCEKFGDIGCDHGHFSEAMLTFSKAESAVCSDISGKCLEKAKKLLFDQGEKVTFAVCDGISKAHAGCDQILIAGMGGLEISHILTTAETLPRRLVLQPMSDWETVRRTLCDLSYRITEDTVFSADGKYYYIMVAEDRFSGENGYTAREFRYGRGALGDMPPVFREILKTRLSQIADALKNVKDPAALFAEQAEIEEILQNGTEKNT